ncbi:hypothetical protein AB0F42_24435 [Streptomyces buecherae]|uniref:hypothetical protein n=1 Tax=Streptomyces buecherae TaxID=2763006 RepID=UPI0033C6AA9F
MNVLMIECPYCRVQQPARVTYEVDADLTRDDLPDAAPARPVADLRAAKTHAATCRARRAR